MIAILFTCTRLHPYTTLFVPRTTTTLGMRSLAVVGPVIWNSLPAALRTATVSPLTLARHLKAHRFGWSAARLRTIYDALYKSTHHHHHHHQSLAQRRTQGGYIEICSPKNDHALHRSRIHYLSKKNSRILTNFPKLKKFVQKFVKCPSVGLNLMRFTVSS